MARSWKRSAYTKCPHCDARLNKDNLEKHRKKVHPELKPGEKRGHDGMTHSERQIMRGVANDQTTDTSNRCIATTKGGTQCTRPVAVQTLRGGYCNQHFNSQT